MLEYKTFKSITMLFITVSVFQVVKFSVSYPLKLEIDMVNDVSNLIKENMPFRLTKLMYYLLFQNSVCAGSSRNGTCFTA